jgi:hypothetical protein
MYEFETFEINKNLEEKIVKLAWFFVSASLVASILAMFFGLF